MIQADSVKVFYQEALEHGMTGKYSLGWINGDPNEWLEENKDIEISHIAQSLTAEPGARLPHTMLCISIWYKKKQSPKE